MTSPEPCCLLTAPCFVVSDHADDRTGLTLPALLARLCDPAQTTIGFPGLQAHQAHAWHAFLVQVAALIGHRVGRRELPADAAWWTDRLRELGGGEAAWTLVVEDLSQPAFMQPPVPEGSLKDFDLAASFSAESDIVLTARNHDYKAKPFPADPLTWIYGLVTVQTTQSYSGKSKYGGFRMNGASGNRIGVGVAPSHELGAWFRQDAASLMNYRDEIVQAQGFAQEGHALLWACPWAGTADLKIETIDPFAIEVCRRLRIAIEGEAWHLFKTGTKAERLVIAKTKEKGAQKWLCQNAYGDPWTPVGNRDKRTGKALTLPETGFTYPLTAQLVLSDGWATPPVMRRTPTTGEPIWYGRTLVKGGQGKIGGWHERQVPIPANVLDDFAEPQAHERLRLQAQSMVAWAGCLRDGVLRPVLKILWHTREKRGAVGQALERVELAIDARFFPHLWQHVDEAGCQSWRQELARLAAETLEAEIRRLGPGRQRWQRIAKANDGLDYRLHRCTHKVLGVFLPPVSATVTA